MSYRIVWFKRDLRLYDHAALAHAASLGPVLCLYAVEPSLWQQADACTQHDEFVKECLKDLYFALRQAGGYKPILTCALPTERSKIKLRLVSEFFKIQMRPPFKTKN